jgi:hypothetical protein
VIFDLQRSVRQGCPLAPYLFLFAVDVLGYMLDDNKWGVEGFSLLDTSKLTNLMFADDTSLFLRDIPENLERAMQILARYGEASGTKINWHKTIAIWASCRDRTWD